MRNFARLNSGGGYTFDEPPTRLACKPLFRQDVIDNSSFRQYGTVILARSLSHTVLTCIFVMLVALIIGFFIIFETHRKAPIQGILVPIAGVTRVFSNQLGVIREMRVKEGQNVREGDILFILSSERATSHHQSTESLISELLAQRRDSFRAELQQAKAQAAHRRAALQQRAQHLQGEIERLYNQATMQQKRISLSEQTVARFEQLKATDYISTAQLQE